MFLAKNDLASVKDYFASNLTSFSKSEVDLMVKLMVCKRLNISSQEYMFSGGIRFSESDLLYFRSVAKRLLKDEPFQHILGEVEFYGVLLKIDERALIPRPETEELVDWVVSELCEERSYQIADVCGGSGCIAFALKSKLQGSKVITVELSDDAVELIQANKQFTDLDIEVVQFDVLNENEYPFEFNSYDCWVSNPPYIPEVDRGMMHSNVLDYEPGMALFVPNDAPLIFYQAIATNANRYLKDGGWLFFEIHESFGKKTIELLESLNFVNIEMRKDLQGKDRMIRAQKRTFVS